MALTLGDAAFLSLLVNALQYPIHWYTTCLNYATSHIQHTKDLDLITNGTCHRRKALPTHLQILNRRGVMQWLPRATATSIHAVRVTAGCPELTVRKMDEGTFHVEKVYAGKGRGRCQWKGT